MSVPAIAALAPVWAAINTVLEGCAVSIERFLDLIDSVNRLIADFAAGRFAECELGEFSDTLLRTHAPATGIATRTGIRAS